MLLSNSEINTLVAACMLAAIRYETEAETPVKGNFLSPDGLRKEAQKYKSLENKLRENFYNGAEYKSGAIKTINTIED